MEQLKIQLPNWYQLTEVELVYKFTMKASERPSINKPEDSYELLNSTWDQNRMNLLEEFKVVYLNGSNKVIGIYEMSKGGITGTVADPRLILAVALKSLTVGMILAHNHPSGSLKPSQADLDLTNKINQACKFHDIRLLDHIILSSEGYCSFANEGLI
jgi:DNA repair protein RadC